MIKDVFKYNNEELRCLNIDIPKKVLRGTIFRKKVSINGNDFLNVKLFLGGSISIKKVILFIESKFNVYGTIFDIDQFPYSMEDLKQFESLYIPEYKEKTTYHFGRQKVQLIGDFSGISIDNIINTIRNNTKVLSHVFKLNELILGGSTLYRRNGNEFILTKNIGEVYEVKPSDVEGFYTLQRIYPPFDIKLDTLSILSIEDKYGIYDKKYLSMFQNGKILDIIEGDFTNKEILKKLKKIDG